MLPRSVCGLIPQTAEESAAYALAAAREDNTVAIDLITQHIRMKLQQPDLRRVYHNLEVIPSNYQIRGMHTIIRDASTSKADFVFYADRLLRLVRPRARFRFSFRYRFRFVFFADRLLRLVRPRAL